MATSVPRNMFSADEISRHRATLSTFSDAAADFLDWVYNDHLTFYAKWGVSKYYGARKPEHKTRELRMKQLKKFGKPEGLVDQQVETACILLAMQACEHGFNATGMAKTWKKIDAYLRIDEKLFGTDLQIILQQLGWKLYYWNPDPARNAEWDAEDQMLNPLKAGRKWMPVWGGHALRYASAVNKSAYYDARVDNASKLAGFKDKQPAGFNDVAFFIGIAHAGYHVFPGRGGDVIEAHSMREMIAKDNIEVSSFNPLGRGGGPRWTSTEKYRSGLIAVPDDF